MIIGGKDNSLHAQTVCIYIYIYLSRSMLSYSGCYND